MMMSAASIIAGVMLIAGMAFAQAENDLPGARARVQKVQATPVAPVTVAPGKPAKVALKFRVVQGFHINSNKPKSELLVPTVVHLSPPTDLSVGNVNYPEGRDLTFPFAPDEMLNVYTGDFAVRALVSAAAKAPPGTYRVHGELKYQACDDRACYPPTKVPVSFDVHVNRAASTTPRRHPGQSPHIHN